MADIYDKNKRTEIMRQVHSSCNKTTELRLIEIFKEYGIKGWKRKYNVKGHPDFVFLEKKIAIFVDGCFWHGHSCRNVVPSDNSEYWKKKRAYNKSHDQAITMCFEQRGWTVIRIWECELRKKNRDSLLIKIKILLE